MGEKTSEKEEDRELTKSEEWFRNKLNDYIQYGLGAFALFAGWLLSSDSIISLEAHADADKKEAAIILAVLLPVIWFVWYYVLLQTHAKCPPHSTIINRRYLHYYAFGLAAALFAIWFMVADATLFAGKL